MKRSRSGGGNRKHGRWLRAPSMKKYVAENRWASNKAKRIARHLKRIAKKEARRGRR